MIALATIEANLITRGLASSTTAELLSYIQAAVRFYSQYNPAYVTSVIDLKSGIDSYVLPSGDTFGVRRIDWWPWGKKENRDDLKRYPRLNFPHIEVDNIFNRWSEFDQFRCRWMVEGGQLLIFPPPDTDYDDVAIVYLYTQPYDYSSASYLTIPNGDDWLITNCALAEYVSTQSMLQSGLPDFTEGLTSVRRSAITRNTASVVTDLRQGVIDKYAV